MSVRSWGGLDREQRVWRRGGGWSGSNGWKGGLVNVKSPRRGLTVDFCASSPSSV